VGEVRGAACERNIMTLLLNNDEIAQLISTKECIEILQEG